jgi:uncharacterized protein
MDETPDPVEILDDAQCWRYLESDALGRLALGGERVEIFPVNYTVSEQRVIVRTGSGTKLQALAHDGRVAFEIDGDDEGGTLWSVVVHGRATEADTGPTPAAGRSGWHPTPKDHLLVIEPDEITGRRFRATAGPRAH